MADALKRQRSACKGGLTKITKFASELTDGSKVSVDEIKTRMVYAKELLERFLKLEATILETEEEESQIDEFEDEYLSAISKLNAALRNRQALPRQDSIAAKHDDTFNDTMQQPISIVKYAKVEIPVFAGDPTHYQSFIDLFNAAVHNIETYTPSQKFQLLKRYLSGEAAALVRHLPITDANYTSAMERLNHRYERKKPVIYAFIRKFTSIPKLSRATASSIRCTHDTADEVLRGLNALGGNADSRDWWLIYLLMEKMDDETKSLWAQETVSKDNLEINDFLKFLDARAEALEGVYISNNSTAPTFTKKTMSSASKSTALTTYANPVEPRSNSCPLCMKEPHRLLDCSKYNAMQVKDRQAHIRLNNRCFNCLNSGHRVKFCNSKSRCAICHRKHHKSLHGEENDTSEIKPLETITSGVTQPVIQGLQATPKVIAVLPTVMVSVVDDHGIEREFRALLDSGSQASFITESCSQQLGLKRTNGRMIIKGIGSTSAGTSRGIITICIRPRIHNQAKEMIVKALVIPKIAANLPELLNREDLKWLSNVQLADPRCYQSRTIDILLGADIFFDILEEGRIKSPNSKLIAQNTKFGWIVGGSAAVKAQEIQTNCTFLDIDQQLRRFWEVEHVGDTKQPELTIDEAACVKHYKENTTRSEDGRFITRLPFKSEPSKLPSNYQTAVSQFHALFRRFKREPELHRLYSEFLREYINLGHMRKVDGPVNTNAYFMPHHGVLKERNTTTKLRVVFNASSKINQNPSLNDILLTGPTVQSTLWAILLRFRLYKYVFSADIEKMYRQVSVHELDQPYQSILWVDDENNLCRYQLTTVTYGTSSAPFAATNSLNELASCFSQIYPQAAKAIQDDIYVDDVLKGANTVEELVKLKRDICAILQSGKFHLRKFTSNYPKLHEPSASHTAKSLDEYKDVIKVLGIQWDPIQDNFRFETNLPVRKKHTKRSILSEASRVFDPFGWLSPLLIKSKIILQDLWRSNIDWDDPLPDGILNDWINLRQEIEQSKFIQLNRFLSSTFEEDEEIELHGFSDASEAAYAAVVFLRVIKTDQITSRLISSKTRVAPLKCVSLPRLELLGAELLANHLQIVINESKLKPTRITLWTDSKIVLDWLSSQPRRWSTFVANRVGAITSMFKRSLWRHIPSQFNPADCASRGISLAELKTHPLWWTGPCFLSQQEQYWPVQGNLGVSKHIEEKSAKIVSNIATHGRKEPEKDNQTLYYLFTKFSSYKKILRICAYVRRVFSPVKPNTVTLSVDEINQAEEILCREMQRLEFLQEYKELSQNKAVFNKSHLLQYAPFLDDNMVMRVGGRIKNSLTPYSTKYPIILSSNWILSHRIVHQVHQDYCHPGPSLLMAMIQEKYCIIGGRNLIRLTFRRCIGCIKQRPRLLSPSHFLLHRPAQQVPDVIDDRDLSPNDRWDMVRKITLNFWHRWQREYLVTLQTRSNWKQPQQNLQENDVILVCEPNLPPGKWMTGRVITVYTGTDGKVRVVKLKTSNGTTMERPISKVCKLPVNESVDSWRAGCSGPVEVLDT